MNLIPSKWARFLVLLVPFGVLLTICYFLSPWILNSSEFTPRIACGPGWTLSLIDSNAISELLIFVSYLILSVGAIIWALRAPFKLTWRDFMGAVIWAQFLLACGLTHLMGRLIFFWPAYRLDTAVRIYCAILSIAAVIQLPYLLRLDSNARRRNRTEPNG